MGKFLVKKIILMILTLLIISSLTFFLVYLLPGGPYQDPSKMTPEMTAVFNAKYGLDDPVGVQYLKYMNNLLHGDLGTSYRYVNRSVNDMIKEYFPVSAQLGLQALAIGIPLGLFFGIASALYRGKAIDYTFVTIAILGVSVPLMVTATLLRHYVGLNVSWLPVAGWGTFAHTILPSISLSVVVIATVTRLMRTSMIEVLSSDYMRTAKSKGLSNRTIIWKHGVRNAILPVVTILSVLIVNLITGSLVVEEIFAIPGLGKHFVNSIVTNDYTLVMGITIFYSALFVVAIFLTDVAYALIDPRIRITGAKE